ncbi:MAG: PEP/pyruvate-binding domain-containing protein, partial [Patescibacteria group bacterium]
LAGGKGASLGEMTQAGIPVPPGYVILAEAFEQFIRETDLIQEIDAVLHQVNHKEIHTVEAASEKIRELILQAEMPEDIAREINQSFKKLNTKYVAVRSSATAEDGKDHAWAGQLESYLNITEDDILTKVKLCWSSLFTPRAIFYRFEKGLHSTKISVAVVVQKMVESEFSGIAFSVHPVTEDHNQLIIEAGFGLGEAIVSGSVTPDSYVVEKEPRNILDVNIATQTRGIYQTGWQDIPEPKASSQVLTKEQILELAELILKIENHYGFPCDIEWAFEKGKFYIVQSRPITTLTIKNKEVSENKNRFRFEKEATRDLSLLVVEGLDVAFINLYKKLKGKEPESTFMIFYVKDFLVEEWIYPELLKELTELIYKKNLEDPSFLKNSLSDYEKHLTLYQDCNITSQDGLQKYLKSLYSAFESFLIFYLTAGNNKIPKDILEHAKKVRDKDKLGDIADKVVRTALKNIFLYTENYETVISINDLAHVPTIDILRACSTSPQN